GNYLGMSTQQTCDGNDFYSRPDYNNGYEKFEVPQFTLNDQLNYAAQQSPATGIMSSIEGNAFAGAGCGILAVCLGDSVEDAVDIAAAERVVGSSTLLIAGIVAPGPGGKFRSVTKVNDALRVAKSEEKGGLALFKWGKQSTTKTNGWKSGDFMLHLPDKGSAKLNWKQNSGHLREQMKRGNPIYDSYRDSKTGQQINTGGFLNAERKLLESKGWKYDANAGAYYPPGS
uniref:hypothetical protein n=1 Tax=Cellvibrio mixtus TaxID=39650 RepID=UPI000587C90C